MQINTNGKRNITLDFDAPKKFKLKKDGAEIPYLRTGKNSFRLGRNIDGVLDLEEIIEQPRIVKPMQLKAQQMALVNPNDVLMINQAAQQLEVEQNILSEKQKRVEQTQAYLDIQQQKINETVLSVQGLENDNAERITATENGIFNLAGNLATVEQNLVEGIGVVNNELQEHKTAENPHGITKEIIGLNKVDNTSDLDKPISKAVQSALDEKADKDEIQAIRDELGEYQEKNDRFTNALSNYTGGLAGNQLPDGGSQGQILAKRSDMSGDAEWIDNSESITIDDELSLTSENPVQNKVITSSVIIKSDTLPTASEDLEGAIYQYSGETGTYTHGYIYECQENITLNASIDLEPHKIVFTGDNLVGFFEDAGDTNHEVVSGRFKYFRDGDIWNINGLDENNNVVFSDYQVYSQDLIESGFTFIVPMTDIADNEEITYDLRYTETSVYNWERIDVQPNQSAEVENLTNRVTSIENKIPAQASSSNQLADKDFVNSSIATNTATFRGTFNSVAELEAYSGEKDNNDYAFVTGVDSLGNTYYDRYKYNGTSWVYEYRLNNSSFTSAQWASINSGATTQSINQISTNTASINSLQTSKQDVISDLATIRSGAALGATALQSGDNISELVNNSGYITSSYHDSTKQNTLIAGEDIEITDDGLPNTYDRLSYIESTGIEYLIAPYKVNNKTKLYCRYKKLGNGGVSGQQISAVIGVTSNASPNKANFGIFRGVPSGNSFNRVGWGDDTAGSVIDISGYVTNDTWYELYFDLNEIYIDNTLVATSATDPSTVWEAQYDLGIFARNSATVEKPFYGQISSVWAKEDDIYVLNLIPCKRKSDNVVGMYDTVSKTFLTNQNDTGAFVAGDIIPVSGEQVISFVNNAGYITSADLPTVNNPTITFTQGGTTKGTITLNQSGDQTIAFDAGGSDVEAFTAAEVLAIWEAN